MPGTSHRLVRTPVGLVPVARPPIATSRLVLEPVAREWIEAFLANGWLIRHPPIHRRVVARNVAADNTPSRRALERAGFVLEADEGGRVAYAFARDEAVA